MNLSRLELLPFGDAPTLAKSKLQHYIHRAPNAPYVSLSNSAISNISDLLPLLSDMRSMLSLDLSANEIVFLPPAHELAARIPQLRSLNLSRNALNVHSIVGSLRSLSALRELSLDLPNQLVLFWMARALPQLRRINGVCFIRENREDGSAGVQKNEVFCPSVSQLHQSVERLRNAFSCGKYVIDAYCRLMTVLRSISAQNLETLERILMDDFSGKEKNEEEVNKNKDFNVVGVAQRSLSEEQRVFKSIFCITSQALTDAQNNVSDCYDSQVVMKVLDRVYTDLSILDNCYYRSEPKVSVFLESTAHICSQIVPMSNGRLHFDNKKFEARNSLLSLLCVAHKIFWDKERHENALREKKIIGFYYTTMQQHVCTYFVTLNPNESETQISARIVDFFSSLRYYADVEKSIEAYVFAQIIDNKIEESYWKAFDSLCTTISNAIECVMSDRVGPEMDKKNLKLSSTGTSAWLHQYASLGFLTKKDVLRLIDIILPPPQRDVLLHVELVETVASLLTVDKHCVPCVTISVLFSSFLGVFVKHHERTILPIVCAFQKVAGDMCDVVSPTQLREILICLGPPADTTDFFSNVWRAAGGTNGDVPITFSSVVEITRGLIL